MKGLLRLLGRPARGISELRKQRAADLATVVHLYYPDLWPVLTSHLRELSVMPFDLFVSVSGHGAEAVQAIRTDFPTARIVSVPNRGRDLAPFVSLARPLRAMGYEFVLKLHSKKSRHRPLGRGWLQEIVANLVPQSYEVQKAILSTLRRSDTGLIGARRQYFALPVNYRPNRRHLLRVLASATSRAHAQVIDDHRWDYGFFAGTMFWARLDAIQPVLDQRFKPRDFDPERGQIDGTLAHGLERALSLVPELNGRVMYEVSAEAIAPVEYGAGRIPEWSDLYQKPIPAR